MQANNRSGYQFPFVLQKPIVSTSLAENAFDLNRLAATGLHPRRPSPGLPAQAKEAQQQDRFPVIAVAEHELEPWEKRVYVRKWDKRRKLVEKERKLILASRVEHTSVFNEEGWMIGHIKDLSIDRQTGEVIFAIMSFGGFLGIGNRLHPLPWSLLTYDTEQHGYTVSLDTKALRDAPHYDASELEEFGGSHHAEKIAHILEFYGRYAPPPF